MDFSFVRKLFKKKRYQNSEIHPDEIFLDSSNLPEFDTHQFEGRLEKSISKFSLTVPVVFFIIVGVVFIVRLGGLQIMDGERYAVQSQKNSLRQTYIFATRGVIYDRNQVPLAWNIENPNNEEFPLRAYATSSNGLSHVIGYVKYPQKDSFGNYYQDNYDGKDGVEKTYDEVLGGKRGVRIVEKDALGNIESQSIIRPPEDGENLTLSIDSRIQNKLFLIIQSTASQYGFSGGSGAIIDVRNGEVLSLVSFPEYSGAVMADGKNVDTIARYLNDPKHPLLNRAISGLYVPGSVIKPFIATAALSLKTIDPKKEILSTGSISLPNPFFPGKFSVFKDWKAHGLVDMRRALSVSSDVYFYTVGGGFGDQKGIGIANIEKFVRRFGIASTTGIDLPGEVDGVVPNPAWKAKNFNGEPWRIGDTYNSSIGQYGFQVTPIQMLRATAAIANGGVLLRPSIILGQGNKNAKTNLDFNNADLQIVREGMRLGTLEGTSRNLNVPFVDIAAKTGTAELGVAKDYVNSWIIGFFPYEAPKYAFVVTMEQGSAHNTIGSVHVMLELLNWMNGNTPEYF